MTPEQLKASILQLAMQGKLVEQRAEEGTAEELLVQIKAEKDRLIKEGKIKKEKPLPEITEDEIPFEIPESWVWVRLTDLVSKNIKRGKSPVYVDQSSIQVFAQKCNVKTGGINMGLALYLDEKKLEKYPDDEFMRNNDIVINSTGGGTMGRVGMFHDTDRINDMRIVPDSHVTVIRSSVFVNPDFLYLYLKSVQRYLETLGDGSTNQTELKATTLMELLTPLPPLAEQKRIVAKIEELLPMVEQYGNAYENLESFNKTFPEDMKKSILQYAMQGKLAEQRAEEGTAEELLEQIKAEKDRLIKEGKIKKEKPLPEITEDEIPFEIPESWKWVRLGNVIVNVQYGTSKKSGKTGIIPVLRMGNIQEGKIDYSDLVYTSDVDDIEKYKLNYNDLLFNRTNSREKVGKVAIYKCEQEAIYAGYLVRITPLIDSDYLNHVMQSKYYWRFCQTVRSDAIGQSNINAEKLKSFIFPLPPLEEQKRIVAKIEELMPYCGQLSKK